MVRDPAVWGWVKFSFIWTLSFDSFSPLTLAQSSSYFSQVPWIQSRAEAQSRAVGPRLLHQRLRHSRHANLLVLCDCTSLRFGLLQRPAIHWTLKALHNLFMSVPLNVKVFMQNEILTRMLAYYPIQTAENWCYVIQPELKGCLH